MDRIIDVFPAAQQAMVRSQLSNVLQAIVAQILLPRADGPGRLAAREILLATPAVRNLIREQKTHQLYSILSSQIQSGMQPLEYCLAQLVRTGKLD
ncbi:twitching motility protein PilT, partial [Arthrospira platensis SPKY2]